MNWLLHIQFQGHKNWHPIHPCIPRIVKTSGKPPISQRKNAQFNSSKICNPRNSKKGLLSIPFRIQLSIKKKFRLNPSNRGHNNI